MAIRNVLTAALLTFFVITGRSQRASVAFQSGFYFDETTYFRFSPKANYLYGYNVSGEHLLWDVKAGRQMKRFAPLLSQKPVLNYLPHPDFSPDDSRVLIPDFPAGKFFLYDIGRDQIIYTFVPPLSGEYYTHAIFSGDSRRVLLVGQQPDDNLHATIYIADLSGKELNRWVVGLPDPMTDNLLVRALLGKKNRAIMRSTANVTAVAATPNLDRISLATLSSQLFIVNLKAISSETSVDKLKSFPGRIVAKDLKMMGDRRLIVKGETSSKDLDKGGVLIVDSMYVVDVISSRIERKFTGEFLALEAERRSSSLSVGGSGLSYNLDIYFKAVNPEGSNPGMAAYSVETGKQLFAYPIASPFRWYTKGLFKPGVLNGGFLVAVSSDGSLMAESSRDIIIHETSAKKIVSSFSARRGGLKLNQPIFIDSFRVAIPKVFDDAFVLDLRDGRTKRIKRALNCQDTARNGANVYFPQEDMTQIAVQNIANTADKKGIVYVNYTPNDVCNAEINKTIEVWDAQSLQPLNRYSFHDLEHSYYVHDMPAKPHTFLVNYKLVSFNETGGAEVKELIIKQKKDLFHAINPIYISSRKAIFGLVYDRGKEPDKDFIFAYWDAEGKLLQSFKPKREKSKVDFGNFITEVQLSPDSSKLLFGCYDGRGGVFDLESNKITMEFEHAPLNGNSKIGYFPVRIMSGCFVNNEEFVTCGDDGVIKLWRVGQAAPVKILNKVPLILLGAVISPDRQFLVGTDFEKTIRIVRMSTGITELSFSAFDYNNYTVLDREGYYMSSLRSNNEFSFLHEGRAYGSSQFDLEYNRPDKVVEKLGYASPEVVQAYRKAYDKRLEKFGYKTGTAMSFSDAPRMEITGKPDPVTEIGDERITVTVSGEDKLEVLSRLFVLVNGVPMYGQSGLSLRQPRPGPWNMQLVIPLSEGRNHIQVSLMNKAGVESLRDEFAVNRRRSLTKPDLYIVAIGAGKYIQAGKNLNFAAKDAMDVAELFEQQKANFANVRKITLVNEKVTKAGILKIKEQLLKTRPDDRVILFYAGHGLLDQQLNYFLATAQTDFENPKGQSIAYEDFAGLLDSIPSRNKLMLIDACHSGEIDKSSVELGQAKRTAGKELVFRNSSSRTIKEKSVGLENSFELMGTLFTDLRRNSGASIISAAGGSEFAVESEKWNNGVFTYCLKVGIKDHRADVNADGVIKVSELLEYLQRQVTELTNGSQQPTSRAENIINDFDL